MNIIPVMVFGMVFIRETALNILLLNIMKELGHTQYIGQKLI